MLNPCEGTGGKGKKSTLMSRFTIFHHNFPFIMVITMKRWISYMTTYSSLGRVRYVNVQDQSYLRSHFYGIFKMTVGILTQLAFMSSHASITRATPGRCYQWAPTTFTALSSAGEGDQMGTWRWHDVTLQHGINSCCWVAQVVVEENMNNLQGYDQYSFLWYTIISAPQQNKILRSVVRWFGCNHPAHKTTGLFHLWFWYLFFFCAKGWRLQCTWMFFGRQNHTSSIAWPMLFPQSSFLGLHRNNSETCQQGGCVSTCLRALFTFVLDVFLKSLHNYFWTPTSSYLT